MSCACDRCSKAANASLISRGIGNCEQNPNTGLSENALMRLHCTVLINACTVHVFDLYCKILFNKQNCTLYSLVINYFQSKEFQVEFWSTSCASNGDESRKSRRDALQSRWINSRMALGSSVRTRRCSSCSASEENTGSARGARDTVLPTVRMYSYNTL